jgi:hypothetical protein
MLLAQKLLLGVTVDDAVVGSITLIDSAVTANSVNAPIIVTRPTTYAAGDYIIVFIGSESGSNLSPITEPAGFTALAERIGNVTGVYLKTATASEPSTYSFSAGRSGPSSYAITVVVRGGSNTVNSSISTNKTAGSVTMPSSGLLLTFHSVEDDVSFTAPTGMTEVAVQESGDSSCGLASLSVEAGPTGNKTATFASSDTSNSVAVGIY